MEHELSFQIFGWLGSLGLIFGYLPQAIQTIRTRNTDGISLPGFIMMSIGSICFMSQGLMLGSSGIFIFITNFITAACAVIIFVIKMKNDYFRKQRS